MDSARADLLASATLGAFRALGMTLAPRAIIALALVGAFVLAVMALLQATVIALCVFSAYCLLVPVPLITVDLVRLRAKG